MAAVFILVASLVLATRTLASAQPAPQAAACESGTLPGGAAYAIAAPAGWVPERDALIVFAPGYRFPQDTTGAHATDPTTAAPLRVPGVAFATLSYRKSGLAVKEGVQDVEELFDFLAADPFACGFGRGARTWLVGGSEGALVATLVTERQARLTEPFIDGTLAACGPLGDFRQQLDYIADFRVVFNALFPAAIPGSAIFIPPDVVADWETTYEPRIRALIAAHGQEVENLLRMTGASYVAGDPASVESTVMTLLRYNVLGAADAIATLGGSPFDNVARVYQGSGDPALDALVDAQAERFAADPVALFELAAHYHTSGRIALRTAGGSDVPLVSLHTSGDPLVPYRQSMLYEAKVQESGTVRGHLHVPIERYGHCAFEPIEVLGALLAVGLLQ